MPKHIKKIIAALTTARFAVEEAAHAVNETLDAEEEARDRDSIEGTEESFAALSAAIAATDAARWTLRNAHDDRAGIERRLERIAQDAQDITARRLTGAEYDRQAEQIDSDEARRQIADLPW